jgi:hypothetical protein
MTGFDDAGKAFRQKFRFLKNYSAFGISQNRRRANKREFIG